MIEILQKIQYAFCFLIMHGYTIIMGFYLLMFVIGFVCSIKERIKNKTGIFDYYYEQITRGIVTSSPHTKWARLYKNISWLLLLITLFLMTNQDFLRKYHMGTYNEDGDYHDYIHYPIGFLVLCLIAVIFSLLAYYIGSSAEKDEIRKNRIHLEDSIEYINHQRRCFNSYYSKCIQKILEDHYNGEMFVYVDILLVDDKQLYFDCSCIEKDDEPDYPGIKYKFIKCEKKEISDLINIYSNQILDKDREIKQKRDELDNLIKKTYNIL